MSDPILPVLLPLPEALARRRPLPPLRFHGWYAVGLIVFILIVSIAADAAAGSDAPAGIFRVLLRWSPFLLGGFVFNLLISFLSMAIGTALGAFLGLGLVSLHRPVRVTAWPVMQFFRNAPWLVLLFFFVFMLPFQIHVGGLTIGLSIWVKAVIALALPVMANTAEIVRGAVRSIHPGQWEAAESLGFTRTQQLWQIILPQCMKRMLPPWMNLYAILTMATADASIVGVNELVTLTRQVLAAEGGRTDLLAPLYGFALVLFFIYSYPIARLTQRLERRYAVKI